MKYQRPDMIPIEEVPILRSELEVQATRVEDLQDEEAEYGVKIESDETHVPSVPWWW